MDVVDQYYYDMVDRYERYVDQCETKDLWPMGWEDWLERNQY